MTDPLQLVGTTIGDKYAVESVVGEGGFAIVYRAMHLIWKRPVAIKAFKAMGSFAEKDRERLLDEFVREGKLLAELSERSAAICQARDIGTMTTPSGVWAPYMVLEWLDGVSLESVLTTERGSGLAPRTTAQAVHILEPVAEALALAHGRGIAHRDVKPGNVMISGDPRSDDCSIKLLDFGIAKVVQDAQKMAGAFSQTSGQITSFTPAYGAPEQFSRQFGSTGPWTDVFALALMFSELVSGKEPLQGDDVAQLGFAAMDPNRRPTPRALGADVTDAVEAVIAKAVSVPTSDRYATAGELWNALRGALAMSPMRAVTGRSPALEGVVSSSSPMAHLPTVPANGVPGAGTARTTAGGAVDAGPPKRGAAIGAGIAGFLVVAGAIGFFATRGGDKGASSPAPGASPSASAPVPSTSAAPSASAPAGCPEGMIAIPGGKFFMGSDEKESVEFERPAHQVTLAPYCIDKFEVTVERYKACSDKGECKRAPIENESKTIPAAQRKAFDPLCNARDPVEKAKHPINCVDWEMADTFCKGMVPHGRLPSEAEWEFAARGPDGRKFPWGDEWPDARHLNACDKACLAWGKANRVEESAMYKDDDGYANTAPVGSFPLGASRYGVNDVVGNVWEWTADWYAPYTTAASTDPKGPAEESDGDGRVIRGGAWNGAYPAWVRPTFRYHDAPKTRSYGIGFRCAASPG